MTRVPGKAQCRVGRPPDGVAELRLSGAWTMDRPRPDWCGVAREIDAAGPPRRIRVVAESIEAWDEALLGFLLKAHRYGAAHWAILGVGLGMAVMAGSVLLIS